MYLVYKPEGQQEQRWLFQPGRLRTQEMIAIERRTGLKYGQFKQELLLEGTAARQALLWTFLRREHHTIRFEDVDFCDDELQLVRDTDELAAEIKALEEFEGVPEDERAAGLALLRQQLATAPQPPGKEPPAVPEQAPVRPETTQQTPPWPTEPTSGPPTSPTVEDPRPAEPSRL